MPGASVIYARVRAGLVGLDEGTFTEGHELDGKTEERVPNAGCCNTKLLAQLE